MENNQSDLTLAGFWIHFLASMIDTFLLVLIIVPLAILFTGSPIFNGFINSFLSTAVLAAVVILFWHFRGATPGKELLALKIVDANHKGRALLHQLITRYIGYFVSMLGLMLGYCWIGWDQKKQGWHDKMAQTLVVRTQPTLSLWKRWVAAFLIISGCFALMVGAGIHWFKKNQAQLRARVEEVIQKGTAFGKNVNQTICMEESINRFGSAVGIMQQVEAKMFLKSCLKASVPTPGFCDGVPPTKDITNSIKWRMMKVAEFKQAGDFNQLFGAIQDYCEDAAKSKTP